MRPSRIRVDGELSYCCIRDGGVLDTESKRVETQLGEVGPQNGLAAGVEF